MTFAALGDCAVVVTLGDAINPTVLESVRDLTLALESAPIPGIVDIVPAYTTVTVFYDPVRFASDGARPYPTLCQFITWRAARGRVGTTGPFPARVVEIPVCYGGEFGPDAAKVASHTKMAEPVVYQTHASVEYTVAAIGFAPGFPYLSGMPASLSTPRHPAPRAKVAAGSVAIAALQTGIYPNESPGGWNIVGRTPLTFFSPTAKPTTLLKAGDKVKFKAITREAFDAWK